MKALNAITTTTADILKQNKQLSPAYTRDLREWIIRTLHASEDIGNSEHINTCHKMLKNCRLYPAPKAKYTKPTHENETRNCIVTLPNAPPISASTTFTDPNTIASYNVNGIIARSKTDADQNLTHTIAKLKFPDVVLLQESKCTWRKFANKHKQIEAWLSAHGYFHVAFYWSSKHATGGRGYAGVGMFSKIRPQSVDFGVHDKTLDTSARVMTIEFANTVIINQYAPNAGSINKPYNLKQKLAFQKALERHIIATKQAHKSKEVMLVGDGNVCPRSTDADLRAFIGYEAHMTADTHWFPAINKDERNAHAQLLNKTNLIDAWQSLQPINTQNKTWFPGCTPRARKHNIGLRLDVFLVPPHMLDTNATRRIVDITTIYTGNSDHIPIMARFTHPDTTATNNISTNAPQNNTCEPHPLINNPLISTADNDTINIIAAAYANAHNNNSPIEHGCNNETSLPQNTSENEHAEQDAADTQTQRNRPNIHTTDNYTNTCNDVY